VPFAGPVEYGLPQVLRVDARRALVRHLDAIYLVHRDRPVDLARPGPAFDAVFLDAARAPTFGLVDPAAGLWALSELALAPTSTRPDGLREVLVAARQHHTVRGDRGGLLFRAWLGDDGLHLDPAPRRLEDPRVRFSSVAIDAAGRALVAVHGTSPLFRAGPRDSFERIDLGKSSPTGTRGHATGVEAVPLVLATRDELHLLDPVSGAWRSLLTPRVPGEPTLDPRGVASILSPDGRLVLWVAAGQAGLVTYVAGELPERVREVEYPRASAACAGAPQLDGRLINTTDHVDVALAGDHAVLALRACPGLALVRRRDRCVHVAPLDPARGLTGPAAAGVDAFVDEGGRPGVLVVADDGGLRFATWEAP
jgi:hypothetical protein